MRRDLLKECNTLNVPVEDLKQAFCVFCYQPECTRSLFGKTKFDQRVSTWKERLFENPPRMNSQDPRFNDIQAKAFSTIVPATLGAISAWDDPRDIKPVSIRVPVVVEVVNPPEETITVVSEPMLPRISASSLPQEVVLINTPPQQGIMLRGGPPSTPPAPNRDNWAAPTPLPPNEKLVQRGATIRFGSGVQGEAPVTKNDQGESQ